jgi:sterol desaturase/sphingolipid hydroxylase (fatty acid hydroxylase superfamily)
MEVADMSGGPEVAEAFRQILTTIGGEYALVAAAFFMIYGVLGRLLHRRKIQVRPFSVALFAKHELPWSFATLVVAGLLGIAITKLRAKGYIVLDQGPTSALRVVRELLTYLVAYDVYFYFLHRALHTDALYERIHRVHHESTSPNPLTGFVFHPVEATITGGFLVTLLSVVHFHQYSLMAIGLYGGVSTVIVHSGYELFPRWWYENAITRLYITPFFHDQHHAQYRCNYGAFTTILDRVFSTMHPSFTEDYRRLHERSASAIVKSAPHAAAERRT